LPRQNNVQLKNARNAWAHREGTRPSFRFRLLADDEDWR
jgi:hypothetical protein